MEGYYQTGPGQKYKGQTMAEIYAEAGPVRYAKRAARKVKQKMSESRIAVLRRVGLGHRVPK